MTRDIVDKSRDRQSNHLTRLWLLAEMILVISGSHSTRSASDPTAMRPLRGNRLKTLAAFVLVTATNWFSSILPVTFWDRTTNHALAPEHTQKVLFAPEYFVIGIFGMW